MASARQLVHRRRSVPVTIPAPPTTSWFVTAEALPLPTCASTRRRCAEWKRNPPLHMPVAVEVGITFQLLVISFFMEISWEYTLGWGKAKKFYFRCCTVWWNKFVRQCKISHSIVHGQCCFKSFFIHYCIVFVRYRVADRAHLCEREIKSCFHIIASNVSIVSVAKCFVKWAISGRLYGNTPGIVSSDPYVRCDSILPILRKRRLEMTALP